ncbi:MAG: hypothetical protein ABJA34_03190 [Pseudonocardiales bacterium]
MKHWVRTVIVLLASITMLPLAAAPAQAEPSGEYAYYNGRTVFFVSAGVVINAQPNLLENAGRIYLITFPVAPGTDGPITLPSGYRPQENGNLRTPYPWHDHVLPALPGPGYSPPMRVVVLRYTDSYAASVNFQPVTSLAGIAAGELAGIFAVLSPGASDPYTFLRPDVLIRPVVKF